MRYISIILMCAAADTGTALSSGFELWLKLRIAARAGRPRQIAQSLAREGLRIVDDWTMPALGIECFVMQAPDKTSLARLVETALGEPEGGISSTGEPVQRPDP